MADPEQLERWMQLHKKEQAGTLTDSEATELRQHREHRWRNTFDVCSICSGSFTQLQSLSKPFACPNCGTELGCFAVDRLSHQQNEVDQAVESEQWLGEYFMWYYPASCTPCSCGLLDKGYYPSSYSCCPSLLVLALQMYCQQNAVAYDFLCKHSQTLVNALRGDFATLFNFQYLIAFAIDSRHPQCSGDLTAIIDRRAT